MLTLLLARLAHADELPLPADTPAVSSAVTVEGVGRGIDLRDATGQIVRLEDALVLVGRGDQVDAVRDERLIRGATSLSCWVVGGAMMVAPALSQSFTGRSLDTTASVGVSLGGAALVGGGFVARFAGRRNHLGDWADEAQIVAAVRTHNALFVGPPAPAIEPGQPPTVLVPAPPALALRVDEDGQLRDARNRVVDVPTLAKLFHDDELAAEYAAGRRMDKALYITAIAVGGGVVIVGVGGFLYGFGVWAFDDEDRGASVMLASLGGGVAGGLLAAGGGVGLGVSKNMRSDPRNWYDTLQLQQMVEAYNAGQTSTTAPLPATQPIRFEVVPLVGPGMVGVAGTF